MPTPPVTLERIRLAQTFLTAIVSNATLFFEEVGPLLHDLEAAAVRDEKERAVKTAGPALVIPMRRASK